MAIKELQESKILERPDHDIGTTENLSATHRHDLHKQLEARHVIMIALGGALGTGLLVGT